MRRRLLPPLSVLLAAALPACGGAARRPPPAPSHAETVSAAAARNVVESVYRGLHGDAAGGVQTLLAEDVVALGPRSADVYATRSDASVALAAAFRGRRRHPRSRALHVVASPGGRSAWASDRVVLDRNEVRVTAVLADRRDLWMIVAAYASRPARAGEDAPAGTGAPDAVGPGAAPVAALFRAAMATPARLAAQLADGRDVVFIGPGAGDMVRGAAAVRRHWKRLLARAHALDVRTLRAALTADGELGWVAADTSAAGRARRLFAIYARTGGGWRLVALHEAWPRD